MISALPQAWKTRRLTESNSLSLFTFISQTESSSRYIYEKNVWRGTCFPEQLAPKWGRELGDLDINDDTLYNSFKKLYAASVSTRVRYFQFKLIHRILGNNEKLFRWGIKSNNMCDLCDNDVETYVHLFCDCPKVKPFWRDVQIWILNETGASVDLSSKEILLGTPETLPPIYDLFNMIAKMYIYSCKINNSQPSIQGFTNRLMNIKQTEKYIAVKNNKLKQFNEKWFIEDITDVL